MRTLARLSFVHRRLVLAAWLAAIALVGGTLGVVGAGYDDAFSLPDTETARVNWWLRGWLGRVLPHPSVEGPASSSAAAQEESAAVRV